MQELIIVNACRLLDDADVQKAAMALQVQIDADFLPAWQPHGVVPVHVASASMSDIPHLDPAAWAIFLNKHSIDPGALGWHDDQGNRIFSRVFVGDCLQLGLSWTVTLSHEALEMMLDPDIRRVFRLADGRIAALEVCDPVEDDIQATVINNVALSNFVLPNYYTDSPKGPYDYRGVLTGPCPTLSPGGYISIQNPDGSWGQIYANKPTGLAGKRALLRGWRRTARTRWGQSQLEVWRGVGDQ